MHTTVHGLHHGLTIVCAVFGRLLFLFSTVVATRGYDGRGQNTAIEGRMLGKKTKNPAKHIKTLYPSINQE